MCGLCSLTMRYQQLKKRHYSVVDTKNLSEQISISNPKNNSVAKIVNKQKKSANQNN